MENTIYVLMPRVPTTAMADVLTNEKVVYQTAAELYAALIVAWQTGDRV